MPDELDLACSCGQVTGVAVGVDPDRGNHLVCMCDDCQAYAHWLGRADELLDAHGGTAVFQLTPAQVRLTGGVDQVCCVRLSEKGLMRWYAGCCRTPIANTLANPKVAFLGLVDAFVPEPGRERLGPILVRTQGRFGVPPLPPGSYARAPAWLLFRSLRQLLRGVFAGAQRPSPVFTDQGAPIVTPSVVSPDERARLREQVARPG